MTDTRPTPNSGPSAVEQAAPAAASGSGWPGGAQGPVARTGNEPNVEAQNESALVAQNTQLAITSSTAGTTPPNVFDAEGKINSGQVRSGLKRNEARHSSFRPFER